MGQLASVFLKNMTIANLYRRVGNIKIEDLKNDAFESVKEKAEELNREQLEKGLNAKGEQIGEYGGFYKDTRFNQGLQTDFVDLKVTGKFHKSIYAKKEGEDVEIFSDDNGEKVQSLLRGGNGVRKGGFGEEIFGLTNESKEITKEMARDTIITIIEEVTNL